MQRKNAELEKATVTLTPPSDAAALQKLSFSGFLPPVVAGIDGFEYRLKGPAGSSNPVLVGLAMFQTVGALDFRTIEDSLPAFVTIVLIPLTLSITQGILWGFILHALLYVLAGRHRELSPTLWVLSVISVGLLGLESR